MEPIGGAKKKKKEKSRKSEFIQIRIPVAKAGSKKYTHVDWNELLRENGKQRDEEELRRFYDEDTLFMAKKLRETKSKSGKKIRVNLDEIQHMNRNCGYDMDDDFIDDTEAVDDTNFVSKKGGFYAGKGNVKDLQDLIEEEEESEDDDDDVIVPEVSKPKKKKIKEKTSTTTATSSDSEPEVVRMTGAPPTARMTGAPPSKRFRPSPPTKEPTPPPGIKAIDSPVVVKKKAPPPVPEVILSSTSSTSSDIICLDDEPPVKKKAPEVQKTSTSSEVNGVAMKNQNSMTTTMMAKKIIKQQEEMINNKKPSAVPSSSKTAPAGPTTPSKPDAALLTLSSSSSQSKPTTSQPPTSTKPVVSQTVQITSLFEKISKKGKSYRDKNLKTFDPETLSDIATIMESIRSLKKEKIDMGPVITTIAKSFGMTTEEVTKQVERAATIQKKPAEPLEKLKKPRDSEIDWKLSKTDLPHMEEPEIAMMTTIVGSWRSKKQLTNSMISGWLKEVREKKMNTDDARVSFYSAINKLPDVDDSTPQDNGLELPKHERSRKPRMFLHQWVYLSRKYVEMILPTLKKMTTEGLALKQLTAVNALKEGLKKQVSKYESAKAKEPTIQPFQFSYTEPILAAVAPYLEEMTDYALATRRLETVVTAIDGLHPPISEHVTLIQFYIEICRRLQKLSFLVVEEPMKKRLSDANEQIGKHQVVQTPKYQIKWPNGEEPSLRGLNRELHVYDKSILEIIGKSPPSNRSSISSISSNPLTSSTPSRPSTSVSKPSTSSAAAPATAPSTSFAPKIQNTSDDVAKRQQAMNQLVQTAEITDSKQFPLSDEILLLLTIAVYSSGVPLPNQMLMFKNLMQNVGQARLANAVAMHKARSSQKLTEKDHQKLFEFFGSLDKKLEQNKQEKINKIQEENQRKIEEKQRKEQEKQAEKERIEARKRDEKERKEKEKREEKERKEREIRENFERKRREEEDRIRARRELEQELEDKRRKKEAEEAVEKELERRAKLETERKIAEAKRAEERENQIKMMRAQQIQRRREDTPEVVVPTVVQPEIVQPVDILNAAQEAADIPIIEPNNIVKQEPEKPMSAFEKLASLRGRTMSADMKRGGDVGTQMGHVGHVPVSTNGIQNMQQSMGVIQNSPYLASQSATQQFFPTSSAPMTQPLQHLDPPVAIHQNSQNSQLPNQSFNSAPIPPMHQPVPRLQHQNPQLNHQAQMHLQQQQQQRLQHQNPNSMSSGAIFQGNGAEQREPNRRSMSMSQPQSSTFLNTQHQSPQTLQQQQFPINSYQSPIHQNSSMSNSSLMHTPHSNNSMVSQSPQFSSHPSPMSQQFHTPPSVGMLTHMNPSPMAQPNPSPLQHFNFPPTASSNYSPQRVAPQQQQQMHRQLSQQNLMMMQQQNPNNQHPMMHQNQLNHHNYPPQ
ncbi:CRE-PQN-80 protein [Caenorhabditis remanei]|uniref:CRE-PQN-80 protein n=1 Tax=Caenorhabditis remanei TaxID=31234 RepID=E3N921_CAERE|nr:CRE-PQN-80 protein [Caenorhabditis remanei]